MAILSDPSELIKALKGGLLSESQVKTVKEVIQKVDKGVFNKEPDLEFSGS